MPNPHAPATSAAGLGYSGITKTGTAIRAVLTAYNACWQAEAYTKGSSLGNSSFIGRTLVAFASMKPLY